MLLVSVGVGPLATHLPAAANGSCLAGAGISVNPYLVTSAADLALVGSGTDGCTLSASYLQTANITLAAPVAPATTNHTPIGSFTGVYDGGGFTIDGPVVVVAGSGVGFFGTTDGATIRNVHITRGSITGQDDTGGLVGFANDSTVSGSSFSGTVTSSGSYVGGLIGYAPGTSVFRSFSEGTVTGTTDVGGLVGYLPSVGVRASFSTADVNGTGSDVGGLIGYFPGAGAGTLRVTGSAVATSSAGASIVVGDTFTWSVDLEIDGPPAGSTGSTPSYANTFNNSVQAFDLVASPGNTGTWVPDATVWEISPAHNVAANANGNNLTIQLKAASGAPDINSVPFLDVKLALAWADADLDAVWQAGTVTLAQWFGTTRPPLEAATLFLEVRDTSFNSPTFAVTLAQDLLQAGDLIDSFARGDVTVTGNAYSVGGLSGYVPSSAISRVYTTGAVSGTGSNIGGLVGQDASTSFTDSFWDTQTSGRATSPAGTGKTTAELTSRATFADVATVGLTTAWPIVAGWAPYVDGTTVWGICAGVNDGYPFLLWQFDTDPCSAPVSSSSAPVSSTPLALSCEGTRAIGTMVTCTVTGGDAGIDILWRAAYNPVIAEAGVTLNASGSGEFSFTVPAAAVGQAITVELVDWVAPVSLGVAGGPLPSSVPSGEGPVPVWPVLLLALFGGLALRRGSRSAWRVG